MPFTTLPLCVQTFGSSYLALAMLSGFVGIPAVVIHTVKGFEGQATPIAESQHCQQQMGSFAA